MSTKEFLLFVALCFLVILALCVAGTEEAKEAERAIANYCDNVSAGAWPDYKGNFKEVCK